METLSLLQAYWWLIIAVLGGILVFLLFVQGGQSMLYCKANESERQLMVNSLGRKWEFTFTTLLRRRFLRFLPAFLQHKLRRRLLAVDAYPAQLRGAGREL